MTLALALLACATYACDDEQTEREPLPDWSDGYERRSPVGDGGVSIGDAGPDLPDAPEDSFAIVVPSDVPYPVRLRRAGTNEACAVRRGSPNEAIDCILDLDELDLFALGFEIDVVAPDAMCDFIHYSGFLFENWQVGAGPTEVAYTVHDDGTFTEETNSRNGEPQCEFDYERTMGKPLPNCCTGSYELTIKSARTDEETTVTRFWGGGGSRCYEGGAFYYENVAIGAAGFPMDELLYVAGKAFSRRYVFEGISELHYTNLPLANYWNPDDHEGGMPAPHRGVFANPYYSFVCEDDAAEWRAHIRLQVREWNEEVEHDAEGDPDTTGTELGWETPINDLEDFGDLTPDGTSFPMLLPVR